MTIDREKYLDAGEVKQFRTVTEAHSIVDLRKGRIKGPLTWMLVDLALSTGLRVSELVALKIQDIDLKRGSMKVVRLKRKKKKTETMSIGTDLIEHLCEYLEWDDRTKGPLFVGQRGPLTYRGLQQMWKAAVAAAGLPDEISIHSARHTLAVHLLKKTSNLRQVQKQLGHASPATTANMYADISFEDMQNGVTGIYD